MEEGTSINKAAKILGINGSTAKVVIRRHKKHLKKQAARQRRQKHQEKPVEGIEHDFPSAQPEET